ncbi:UDP-N-acetylmuramoyl-L-alanyl-D-glutamate--2,6-diaminopimelate ligase [Salsuginibacillus halophilus]|nr:UDP-N-acetylmuramoyl-L-alanyl-D-glutamate--2,6-diaminopimelate ligase [Salsuginibacillus halophilus]
MKTLKEVCAPLLAYEQVGAGNPDIQAMTMDSRGVIPGALFICVNGYTVDGHTFARDAAAKGAAAIVAEQPVDVDVPVIYVRDTKRAMAELATMYYDQPSTSFKLIGVTGTNGKTTVTHLLENIFARAGETPGLIGTLYTRAGEKSLDAKNTTPESLTLQQTFAWMKDEGVTAAAMEVSSHALTLGRTRGAAFDVAVLTNVTEDHLDFHETKEDYEQAKGLLFAQLGNEADGRFKAAVLNADDPVIKKYQTMTAAPVITYGCTPEADVYAEDLSLNAAGVTFTLHAFGEARPVKLQLMGKFSVYNALAAAAAALVSGFDLETVTASLEEETGVRGRFEPVDAGQNFGVIVDYAHTTDSLENVLQAASEMTEQRLITVVGCGGDRDRGKRPKMAAVAEKYSDEAVFTSDNPRSENPAAIIEDMKAGASSYTVRQDRREAIDYAIAQAGAGDVVVIAGKGHETYQEVQGETLVFDDREEALKALARRTEGGGTV